MIGGFRFVLCVSVFQGSSLLKLNFKGPYPSSEREIKFRHCLFTSSIKHEIRHFHVVVVQKWERNVQKKCDARLLIKPIIFLTFSSPSASLDLKVPIIFMDNNS